MNRSLKTSELLQKIKEHLRKETYVVSAHALQRQNQRLISLEDVLYVLKTGTREESKDLFDVKRQMWKYAIRGNTADIPKITQKLAFRLTRKLSINRLGWRGVVLSLILPPAIPIDFRRFGVAEKPTFELSWV